MEEEEFDFSAFDNAMKEKEEGKNEVIPTEPTEDGFDFSVFDEAMGNKVVGKEGQPENFTKGSAEPSNLPSGNLDLTGDPTEILRSIREVESGGNYNAYYGNPTNKDINFEGMSIKEVLDWQNKNGQKAAGGYQFKPETLKNASDAIGIGLEGKFTKENQDKLASHLLKKRGFNRYLAGEIEAKDFGYELSKEWASFPVLEDAVTDSGTFVTRGETYYKGTNNKALISPESVEAVLAKTKETKKQELPKDLEIPDYSWKTTSTEIPEEYTAMTADYQGSISSGISREDLERAKKAEAEAKNKAILDKYDGGSFMARSSKVAELDAEAVRLNNSIASGQEMGLAVVGEKLSQVGSARAGYILTDLHKSEDVADYNNVINSYNSLTEEDKKAFRPLVSQYEARVKGALSEQINEEFPDLSEGILIDEDGISTVNPEVAGKVADKVAQKYGYNDKVKTGIYEFTKAKIAAYDLNQKINEKVDFTETAPEVKGLMDNFSKEVSTPKFVELEKNKADLYKNTTNAFIKINSEYGLNLSEQLALEEQKVNSELVQGVITKTDYLEVINRRRDQVAARLTAERDQKLAQLGGYYEKTSGELVTETSRSVNLAWEEYKKENNLEEEQAKYFQNEYTRAVNEIAQEKQATKLESEEYQGIYLKNLTSSLGGAISGISQSLGFYEGVVFGDYLKLNNEAAVREVKNFSDLLDTDTFAALTGNLTGSTVIPTAMAATATLLTRGMVNPISMGLGGLASWSGDTMIAAGNAYQDVLAESGSVAEATNAYNKTIQAQIIDMPLYALDALPFVGSTLNKIKVGSRFATASARVATAGAIGYGVESAQEITQGAQGQQIKETGDWVGFASQIDKNFVVETMANVAPTLLLGLGGQTVSVVQENVAGKKLAKSIFDEKTPRYMKDALALTESAPDVAKQFLYKLNQEKGTIFTTAMIETMKDSGYITPSRAVELFGLLNTQIKNQASKDALGLNPKEAIAYYTLVDKYNQISEKAKAIEGDDVTKSILQERANKFKQSAREFLEDPKKGGSFITVELANNTEFYLSTAEFKGFLQKDGIANKIASGKIKVDSRNIDGIQELINQRLEEAPQTVKTTPEAKKSPAVDVRDKANTEKLKQSVDPQQRGLIEMAEKAANAISKILPNVDLVVYANPEEYKTFTGGASNGQYDKGYDGNRSRISINLNSAKATTIAHEVFHAALLEGLQTEKQAQAATKELMSAVQSNKANRSLLSKYDDFVTDYEEAVKDEERLAELFGDLAANYTSLDKNLKQKIKQWVNKVSNALGIGNFFEDKDISDANAIDLLNTLASKVRSGEEAQAGEQLKKQKGESTKATKTRVRNQEEARKPEAGKRLFNDPNPETKEIADKYKKDNGINTPDGVNITKIDTDNSIEIADAHEALEDSPNDLKVQEAYSALANETAKQHKAIVDAGYEVELWQGKGEPYANSQEMIDDVRDNKHMYIYSTEEGFGQTKISEEQREQNKLLRDSGFKDKNGNVLLYNDLFRFVHDFFGHTERGNGFGAVGEENAWDVHSRMYTPLARRAMTTETRGQNSWVNFGPNVRDENGNIIKKGEKGYLAPQDRPFAPQKMALMPEKYSELLQVNAGVSPEEYVGELNKATKTRVRKQRDEVWEKQTKENLPDSQIKSAVLFEEKIKSGKWGMLTGENPNAEPKTEEENKELNERALTWIKKVNSKYNPIPIFGKYGNPENSFFVENLRSDDAAAFAREFEQESVATDEGLIYPNGDRNPRVKGQEEFNSTEDDYYSTIRIGDQNLSFKVGYDLDVRETALPEEIKEKLTDDGKGNYLFYHYSFAERDVLKPSAGDSSRNFTSKEEASALSSVGGVVMFYVDPNTKEQGVGNVKHIISIPKEKVYHFQTDRAGLFIEAEALFKEARPNQAFTPNLQAAWISKVLDKAGYEIMVANWGKENLRAQTTEEVIVDETLRNEARAKKEEEKRQKSRQQKPEDSGFESIEGFDRYKKELDGVIERAEKIGRPFNEVLEDAIAYTQISAVYERATDTQREEMIRALRSRFGKKERKAPTPKAAIKKFMKKFRSEPKEKKVTMTEAALLKEHIKSDIRTSKLTAAGIKEARQAVSNTLKELVGKGVIKASKVATILSKYDSMNVLNPKMRERFITYVSKIFDDAEYDAKLTEAQKLRKSIKKAAKSKNTDAVLGVPAKDFVLIDPSTLADIDKYLEVAKEVASGIKSSRVNEADISISQPFNVKEVAEYTESAKAEMEDYILAIEKQTFEEITGIDASDLTLEEMLGLLNEEEDSNKLNSKEALVRGAAKRYFSLFKSIVTKMLSGVDPFTGEELDIDPKQAQMIKEFMDINFDRLKTKEIIQAIDILNRFMVNGRVGGIEKTLNRYKGEESAFAEAKKGTKGKKAEFLFSEKLGRLWMTGFTQINIVFERMFRGVNQGQRFMKAMGLTDLINSANAAQKRAEVLIEGYQKVFKDLRPNGKDFKDPQNNLERSMYASLKRTIAGTQEEQAKEFARVKSIIDQSIKKMAKGDAREQALAEVAAKVYTKVVAGSSKISDVEAKISPINKKAADFWITAFSGVKPELDRVSLDMYNTILETDISYTPMVYKTTTNEEQKIDDDKSGFSMINNSGVVTPDKVGQLKQANRPVKLPANRYLSLDFDTNMANSYYAGLMDVSTAPHISKIKGFMESKSAESLFGSKEDFDLVKDRINHYINLKRGTARFTQVKDIDKAVNFLAKMGATRALAGFTQPIKQVLPVALNAIITGGGENFAEATTLFSQSKEVREFINSSGYGIANRGASGVLSIDNMNKEVDKLMAGKAGSALDKIGVINEKLLETMLVGPDIFIAKASWLTYYIKNLKAQGIDTKNLDWTKHKVNTKAGDLAQAMVDRQQNTSDADLQGKLFTNRDTTVKFIRSVFFPFMTFVLNQKERMYSDIIVLSSKTATTEDQKLALKSLIGTLSELSAYSAISYFMGVGLHTAAMAILGESESDEEKEIRAAYARKGKLTSFLSDILSPLPPVTDPLLMITLNSIYSVVEDPKAKVQGLVYKPRDKSALGMAGSLGISIQRLLDTYDVINMAITGKFSQNMFGKDVEKVLSEKDRQAMAIAAALISVHSLGGGPVELNTIGNDIVKTLKRGTKQKKTSEQKPARRVLGGYGRSTNKR